jgi:hypothetical protein
MMMSVYCKIARENFSYKQVHRTDRLTPLSAPSVFIKQYL